MTRNPAAAIPRISAGRILHKPQAVGSHKSVMSMKTSINIVKLVTQLAMKPNKHQKYGSSRFALVDKETQNETTTGVLAVIPHMQLIAHHSQLPQLHEMMIN